MAKVLCIDYQKCTGCRTCEQVCVVKHEGVLNPIRSRIRIMKWEAEGLYVPMLCSQCQDAPCVNVCPVRAIHRDDKLGRVWIDYDICIGCRSCITVCPFGAMSFNPISRQVFKCDLCDGDPQCVRFCDVGALTYIDAEEISTDKKWRAAQRVHMAGGNSASLIA